MILRTETERESFDNGIIYTETERMSHAHSDLSVSLCYAKEGLRAILSLSVADSRLCQVLNDADLIRLVVEHDDYTIELRHPVVTEKDLSENDKDGSLNAWPLTIFLYSEEVREIWT